MCMYLCINGRGTQIQLQGKTNTKVCMYLCIQKMCMYLYINGCESPVHTRARSWPRYLVQLATLHTHVLQENQSGKICICIYTHGCDACVYTHKGVNRLYFTRSSWWSRSRVLSPIYESCLVSMSPVSYL